MDISSNFPKYTEYSPEVPVWCVTPDRGGAFHRFFDTSPFNPSGTKMVLTRMMDEQQPPRPGDPAEIVIVDLKEGSEKTVATSYG